MDRQSRSESAEQCIVPEDAMKTVCVEDHYHEDLDSMQEDNFSNPIVEATIPVVGAPSPSLPSSLLCHDIHSLPPSFWLQSFLKTSAWAKLSGLPPCETGRCKHALGQALDWRLWVGKSAVASQRPWWPQHLLARLAILKVKAPSHHLRHLVPHSCFPPPLPWYPLR